MLMERFFFFFFWFGFGPGELGLTGMYLLTLASYC